MDKIFFNFNELYRFIFLKFETLWASLSATTQQVGIADLTASTASGAVPLVDYSGKTSSLYMQQPQQSLSSGDMIIKICPISFTHRKAQRYFIANWKFRFQFSIKTA
jgi:hypothetical protein